MKRSTEERRWANGLRQTTTSNANAMECSTMHRNNVLKTPSAEVPRRSDKCFVSTSLAATQALQAYLAIDTDAQSRIPRRTLRTHGNEKVRASTSSGGKTLNNKKVQSSEIKFKGNARVTQLPTSCSAIPTSSEVVSRAESPLSRFQKHVRHKQDFSLQIRHQNAFDTPRSIQNLHFHNSRGRDIPVEILVSDTVPTLTRSLMDKIQEAKRLRQSKPAQDHQLKHHRQSMTQNFDLKKPSDFKFLKKYRDKLTDTDRLRVSRKKTLSSPVLATLMKPSSDITRPNKIPIVSTQSPPLPHPKPVMPAIPLIPDNSEQDVKDEETLKTRTKDTTLANTKQRINHFMTVINAVRAIQQLWRLKRQKACIREENQVTLIIDKNSENGHVIPLFATDNMKFQNGIKLEQQQTSHVSNSTENLTLKNAENVDIELECKENKTTSWSPYDPWMDHELVFLEEGRCIGELQESVQKGVLMDQDELVWKRPQHLIQQLEAQRVELVQKSRRRRRRAENDSLSVAGVDTLGEGDLPSHVRLSTIGQKITNTGKQKRKIIRFTFSKYKKTRRGTTICMSRRSKFSKSRTLSTRIQRVKISDPRDVKPRAVNEDKTLPERVIEESDVYTEALLNQRQRSSQHASSKTDSIPEIDVQRRLGEPITAVKLDHFVLFESFSKTSTENDIRFFRNDLISVGDLALARNLLYEKRHCPPEDTSTKRHEGFIPLTVLSPLNREIEMDFHQPALTNVDSLIDTNVHDDEDNNGDCRIMENCTNINCPLQIGVVNSSSTWELSDYCGQLQQGTQMDNQCTHSIFVTSSCTELCNQQLEPSPVRPRLNEDKRIEFLRVLNDFKRCLSSTSTVTTPDKATESRL